MVNGRGGYGGGLGGAGSGGLTGGAPQNMLANSNLLAAARQVHCFAEPSRNHVRAKTRSAKAVWYTHWGLEFAASSCI